jgi:hypothetical protein
VHSQQLTLSEMQGKVTALEMEFVNKVDFDLKEMA